MLRKANSVLVIVAAAGVLVLCGAGLGEEFELTVNVVGNGIADPNGGTYESGTVVTIETWPEAGHWVKSWSGSDDDASSERMNTVTMDSDKVVTVEFAAAIIVNMPAGGDVWASGSTHEIGWSSYGAGAVDILLSVDGGDGWENIASGVSDSGGYTWRLPNKAKSKECLISVVPSVGDANVVCIKSGVFEIQRYHGPASLPRRKKHPGPKPGEKYGPEFGCVKWKFETDGPVTAGVSIGREIDERRKVYVACEDGKLYALDFDTGALLWSYDVGSALVGSAAEGPRGSVYVGSTDGKVYAIDRDGELLWSHRTEEPIFSSPVVSAQCQIYVCSEDGTVYALRRDGSENWKFETNGFAALDGAIFATPQIAADGTVYVAGLYDPNLYALNPEDGGVKWVCNFEHTVQIPDDWGETQDVNLAGWPFAPSAIGPDGTIYMSPAFDTHLFAIEPETGSITWSTNLWGLILRYGPRPEHTLIWYGAGEPPEYVEVDGRQREVRYVGAVRYAYCWSQPAVGPDGTIYVSFDDAYLRAVEPNGSKKWFSKLGELGAFTLAAGDDGLVYAASDDNQLYVVDPNGEEVARFEGDDWLSHPTIAPGSTIVVSDANNTVWAITEEDCGDKPIVLDLPPGPNEPNEP